MIRNTIKILLSLIIFLNFSVLNAQEESNSNIYSNNKNHHVSQKEISSLEKLSSQGDADAQFLRRFVLFWVWSKAGLFISKRLL